MSKHRREGATARPPTPTARPGEGALGLSAVCFAPDRRLGDASASASGGVRVRFGDPLRRGALTVGEKRTEAACCG